MTMATTLTESRSRSRWRSETLDVALLLLCFSVAFALFFDGGAEALAGAAVGALIAARAGRGPLAPRTLSAAFAGLFAGALFAGLLHSPLAALSGQLL